MIRSIICTTFYILLLVVSACSDDSADTDNEKGDTDTSNVDENDGNGNENKGDTNISSGHDSDSDSVLDWRDSDFLIDSEFNFDTSFLLDSDYTLDSEYSYDTDIGMEDGIGCFITCDAPWCIGSEETLCKNNICMGNFNSMYCTSACTSDADCTNDMQCLTTCDNPLYNLAGYCYKADDFVASKEKCDSNDGDACSENCVTNTCLENSSANCTSGICISNTTESYCSRTCTSDFDCPETQTCLVECENGSHEFGGFCYNETDYLNVEEACAPCEFTNCTTTGFTYSCATPSSVNTTTPDVDDYGRIIGGEIKVEYTNGEVIDCWQNIRNGKLVISGCSSESGASCYP